MKRMLAGLLAVALLTGSAGAAEVADEMAPPPEETVTQPTDVQVDYTAAADALYALGLFQGKYLDAAGRPVYDLAAPCTRAEAAVMLVRLLGKEAEAKAENSQTPFTDLADWQKPAVGWLYRRGLATGASYDKFEPESRCTAQMYATFTLRALGYSDQKGDFTYDSALRFATKVGLIDPFSCDIDDFRRDDAAQMSRMALLLPAKGSADDLLATLTQAGVVDADEAAAFRAVTQPVADLRARLTGRKPYEAAVFAALLGGGDSMSFTGTLYTDERQTVCEGMLSAALANGRSVSRQVTIVRLSDGVYISDLTGTAYRDDQLARLLRESGILDVMTAETPAESLITTARQSGNACEMTLAGGGEATVTLDADGQPALRTLSMQLHGADYAVTVQTTNPAAASRPQATPSGYVKIHEL